MVPVRTASCANATEDVAIKTVIRSARRMNPVIDPPRLHVVKWEVRSGKFEVQGFNLETSASHFEPRTSNFELRTYLVAATAVTSWTILPPTIVNTGLMSLI